MAVAAAQTAQERQTLSAALRRYFLFSYLAMLANAGRYLEEIDYGGTLGVLFAVAVLLTYCAAYLFPFALPAAALGRLLSWLGRPRASGRPGRAATAGVYVLAVAGMACAQMFIHVDVFLYRLWGYHLNSFVLNVLTTPGGWGSLGAGESTVWTFVATVAAIAAGQALLLVLAVKARRLSGLLDALIASRRRRVGLVVVWALLAVSQAVGYGVCKLRWYTPVLDAAGAFPFYFPVTFSKIGRRMGWVSPHADVDMHVRHGSLSYPLEPLAIRADAPRYNIVWLVCESLRADMVTGEIMPRTHAFASRRALWFRRCYGAGDGTRMGMFGMFYGLHGSYWFAALNANRGPVLMDVLRQGGYRFDCRTSQSFTYPEFDRTIFARVPPSSLHVIGGGTPGWQRDRQNVSRMLSWLDARDPNAPFFQFMFFESSHARYFFPPESVIREPYLRDFNYADLDAIGRDPKRIRLLKNRYVNSCHHLDSQIGRVLEYLQARGLLETTLVVITGDHGQEFWEPDRWGHPADSFHEAHARVPLILHVPGAPAATVDRMVSHLDIPPTVLRLLGVENPPGDYCLGMDLLGSRRRTSTCVYGWDFMAYIDDECKIVQRYRGPGFAASRVTGLDDRSLAPDASDRLLRRKLPGLLGVLKEMKRFGGK